MSRWYPVGVHTRAVVSLVHLVRAVATGVAVDDRLDNPVWHALTTRQAGLARRAPLAANYHNSVSPFAAVSDPGGDPGALNSVVETDEVVLLAAQVAVTPAKATGWEPLAQIPVHQMVCPEPVLGEAADVQRLGEHDAKAMVSLARLTEPGPFEIETHLLGNYFGVYEDADLVAMAGERFSMPGLVEVSGVCSHPSARGKGYAIKLVARLLADIAERGEIAFLHVREGSPSEMSAIYVYERLGFRHHQKMLVHVMRHTGA